jgi:hypothetical protein
MSSSMAWPCMVWPGQRDPTTLCVEEAGMVYKTGQAYCHKSFCSTGLAPRLEKCMHASHPAVQEASANVAIWLEGILNQWPSAACVLLQNCLGAVQAWLLY